MSSTRSNNNPAPAHAQWPATQGVPAPPHDAYAAAAWLLGRYPRLAGLTERLRGVVEHDASGPWLDLKALARAIDDFDEHDQAGRQPGEYTAALDFAYMSRSEQARLRLLAFFAPTRVGLRVDDLLNLDGEGQQFLRDWTEAVLAA